MADEAAGIDQEYQFVRWSTRVRTFLAQTLGEVAATGFEIVTSLTAGWPEILAMRQGYVEGIVAKAADAEHAISNSSLLKGSSKQSEQSESRKVFVVHGHDESAKESVARFIEKVGLKPIILHEQASGGRTVIEKFEIFSDDVAFAVVLLTPDDMGAVMGGQSRSRARQNVIMELGYFMGRLGRTRVCALYKGDVELPSDVQGVLYVPMDSAGAWKNKLAHELVQAKIAIDLNGLLGT
jgi:predicted nucleotide-binding protein